MLVLMFGAGCAAEMDEPAVAEDAPVEGVEAAAESLLACDTVMAPIWAQNGAWSYYSGQAAFHCQTRASGTQFNNCGSGNKYNLTLYNPRYENGQFILYTVRKTFQNAPPPPTQPVNNNWSTVKCGCATQQGGCFFSPN